MNDDAKKPGRVLSNTLVGPRGEPVVKIETIDVSRGQGVTITFEHVAPRWRQGVFVATDGVMRVACASSPSFVLWQDSAPAVSTIEIVETEGSLTFYNVWDSGRGKGRFESQAATSGMLVEHLGERSSRYRCNDIGVNPDFHQLVFSVQVR